MVREALKPGGRVPFVDDNTRTLEELVYGEESSVVERRLGDGTAYRAGEAPHQPENLQARLHSLGWDITVVKSGGPFYWGAGSTR
jgi:hypothetical protein